MSGFTAAVGQASKANTPSLQTGTTALAVNVNRAGWAIQNQGTSPLAVLLGSGATPLVFHVVLKGGSALNDGNGGIFSQTVGIVYQGIVTSSGSNPTYTVLEM